MTHPWRVAVLTSLTLALAACGEPAAPPVTAGAPVRAAAADYTSGVSVAGSTATVWFKSSVNTTWVDVHYTLNAGGQQNLRMTYNATAGRYEQRVGVTTGDTLAYSFTYNNGTPAYDTPTERFTVGGSTPPPSGPSGSIGSVPASAIPAPSGNGVMALKVMNGTNGAYADNQLYWGVLGINPANNRWSYLDLNGQLQPTSAALNDAAGHLTKNNVNYANIYHRVSDAAWASLPRVTSGRMFLCVGTPCFIRTFDAGFAGPDINNPGDPNRDVYFDFIEFTVNDSGYHGNTTRVDAFGFPLEHRLVNRAGTYDRTVGEPESESRAAIFSAFRAEVPGAFTHLANIQAPYRIVAPIFGDFRAGGPQGNYFAAYVNQVWTTTATKPTTQEILLCNGNAADAAACAAINRHVYENAAARGTPSQYYLNAPANFYARFWHRHSLGGLAYGFAYDDVNQQAAYLEVGDPKGLIVRVGW